MVSREQLTRRALRAYELGRLRVAARAGWIIVPAVALCAFETGAGETCACLGILLLCSALYLRWRDRSGVESVSAGFLAGSIPLAVGLILGRWLPDCAGASLLSACTAICLGVGLPSGIWLGYQSAKAQFGLVGSLTATGIAVLAASLGCSGLGTAGLAGAVAGVVGGRLIAVLPAYAIASRLKRVGVENDNT
jgi:hypothetical protein